MQFRFGLLLDTFCEFEWQFGYLDSDFLNLCILIRFAWIDSSDFIYLESRERISGVNMFIVLCVEG